MTEDKAHAKSHWKEQWYDPYRGDTDWIDQTDHVDDDDDDRWDDIHDDLMTWRLKEVDVEEGRAYVWLQKSSYESHRKEHQR